MRIDLPNRYGEKNYLESCGKNKFKLVLENNNSPISVIGTWDNPMSIDPSGGPMISVGEEISDGYIIDEIKYIEEKGFILKTIKKE